MGNLSTDAIEEYQEQVASFRHRANSKAEGEAALIANSGTLLANLADLLPTMEASPAYAGLAFYGRFQPVNLKLIKRLVATGVNGKEALDAIRTDKALRVSAAAKTGWDYLLGAEPESLWKGICLALFHNPVAKTLAAKKKDDEEDGDGVEEDADPENGDPEDGDPEDDDDETQEKENENDDN